MIPNILDKTYVSPYDVLMSEEKILTASQARANIYQLIKSVSTGLKEYVITLKEFDPVILVNKEEYDSWRETAEILAIKNSLSAIKKGQKQAKKRQGVALESLS